ncbi:hypothetical protein VTN00DRAFT_9289 [Thermoascus crustaceus]|uniref:uncharacterized protein n=1 Tax=Thermoascus crustaceus TaxID=5088 RepID=UPI003743A3DF
MKFSAALTFLAAPLAVMAVPAASPSPSPSPSFSPSPSPSSKVDAAAAGTVDVKYDPAYDNPDLDLNTVSCSDGPNGLVTKGYKTAGSLPSFPRVGAAFSVSWNSPNCGKCYQLTYNGKSIYVTAIDQATTGFNIAQEALDELTGGQAVQLGHVQATYAEAAPANCGF